MRSLLSGAAIALIAGFAAAQDPADSWLAYAKAAGNGKKITTVNMTWTVPAYPTTRDGGNAPGWWFGIEPTPALDLIQPILAYGDGTPEYTIFNGEYDWHNSGWFQSSSLTVTPGDVIFGSTVYDASTDSYVMIIKNLNASKGVKSVRPVKYGEVYTDAYIVTEHQPNSCSEYPANGGIVFSNIVVAWEGEVSSNPGWTAQTYQPACNSQAQIVDNSTVAFTWDTSASIEGAAAAGTRKQAKQLRGKRAAARAE